MRAAFAVMLIAAAAAKSGERLYVVTCDGRVDVVDTASGAAVRRVDVAKDLPIRHRQSVAGATFDNCLMNQAVYAPRSRAFYSLVPDSDSEPQNYAAWRFAVPGFAAKIARKVRGADLPTLVAAADGSVGFAAAAGPGAFDLKPFPAGAGIRHEIIEASGGFVLLRLFEPGPAFAVAGVRAKALVRLTGVPPTSSGRIHLVPGGAQVYAEQAAGSAERPLKTGAAALYDARTGRRLRGIADRRIRTMTFLTITPGGRAVYFGGGGYASIDLRARYPDIAVTVSRPPPSPASFVVAQ